MEQKKIQSKKTSNQKQDEEASELLQNSKVTRGKQLRIDVNEGVLEEVDELRGILKSTSETPEEKYDIYYRGIRRLLMKYLPKGPEHKHDRQLIYDEKNIFLNRGKRKSDNNGIRKSDGRMIYQPVMNEMLDIILEWASESQNPFDIYQKLYNLNEKHGYGHEIYDKTSLKYQKMNK